jgi:hypothetical protein
MSTPEEFDELSEDIINYVIHKIGKATKDGIFEDEDDCQTMYIVTITNIIMIPIKFHNGKEYTKQEVLKYVKGVLKTVYKLVEAKENKKLH